MTFNIYSSKNGFSLIGLVVIVLIISLFIIGVILTTTKKKTSEIVNSASPIPSPSQKKLKFPTNQSGLRAVAIKNLSMPGYLQRVTDLTFGNHLTRISDQVAFDNTDNLYLFHNGPRIQAWNADESLIFLAGGKWDTGYLLDGQTGTYLRTVNPGAIGNSSPRWSNVNPNNMYGIAHKIVGKFPCNSTNRMVVWHPKTDISSHPNLTTMHVFTQYDSYSDPNNVCANMSFGESEGNFSNDDLLGVVIGWSSKQNSWGITTFNMTNVNADTPIVNEIATIWLSQAGGTVNDIYKANWNNISATPKGDGVLLGWNAFGPGINQGTQWFSKDLTTTRHVTDSNSHADTALDENGNQLLVTNCAGPYPNTCTGVTQGPNNYPFIAGYYITSSGPSGSVNLYPYQYPASATLTVSTHISCRNQFQRPGWCYISDYQNNPAKPLGLQQIYALKLDGSKTVEVFGVSHSSYNTCETCNEYAARAVPNHDGSRVIFTSDWGGGTSVPSYDYIAQWPE